jgi:hypothetical protein
MALAGLDRGDHGNVTHTGAQGGRFWFRMISATVWSHLASVGDPTNPPSEITTHTCLALGAAVNMSGRHPPTRRDGRRLEAANWVRRPSHLSVVHAPTHTGTAVSSSRTSNAQPFRLGGPPGASGSPEGAGACASSLDLPRRSSPAAPAEAHPARSTSANTETLKHIPLPPGFKYSASFSRRRRRLR